MRSLALDDELSLLRALVRVGEMADAVLEDCLKKSLGLAAAQASAYVADPVGNQTLVVDIASLKEVAKIKVGQVPKRNFTMVVPSRTATN